MIIKHLSNGKHSLDRSSKPNLKVSLASGYASQHIMSQSPSPEIGMVVAGRASGIKLIWDAWLG